MSIPNTELIRTICAINPALCRESSTNNEPVYGTTLPNGTTQVRVGGTTLDKLLNTLTTSLALFKNAPYIPTTQQPIQQQQQYFPEAVLQPSQNYNSTGATFGASIENFVTNNTGVIAIGVVAYVLLMSGRKK